MAGLLLIAGAMTGIALTGWWLERRARRQTRVWLDEAMAGWKGAHDLIVAQQTLIALQQTVIDGLSHEPVITERPRTRSEWAN